MFCPCPKCGSMQALPNNPTQIRTHLTCGTRPFSLKCQRRFWSYTHDMLAAAAHSLDVGRSMAASAQPGLGSLLIVSDTMLADDWRRGWFGPKHGGDAAPHGTADAGVAAGRCGRAGRRPGPMRRHRGQRAATQRAPRDLETSIKPNDSASRVLSVSLMVAAASTTLLISKPDIHTPPTWLSMAG